MTSYLIRLSFSRLRAVISSDDSDRTIYRLLRYLSNPRNPAGAITGGFRDHRLAVKYPSALAQPTLKCYSDFGQITSQVSSKERSCMRKEIRVTMRELEIIERSRGDG